MPSLRDSAIQLDSDRYRAVSPSAQADIIQHAPAVSAFLTKSPVMISSLPSIATSVDGIVRQFYGIRNLPQRRLILPG
jgi:hypothetical protein